MANLGQLKHERAEAALLALVGELEGMLIRPAQAFYDPRESRLLLDRVVAALARFGTSKARRAVVEHGLKNKAELGDTIARLSELAGQDLSGDPELVDRLLAALKANAPRKVLGILVHSNDQRARHIIEALSATPFTGRPSALDGARPAFPGLGRRQGGVERSRGSMRSPRVPGRCPETRSGSSRPFGLPGPGPEPGAAGRVGLADARRTIEARSDPKSRCGARG